MIPWDIKILTLFPELFPGPLGLSVTGRGLQNNFWGIESKNIKDYAADKHDTVDDMAYGGGGGMILKPDIASNAIKDFFSNDNPIIYPSPRGKVFTQKIAADFSEKYSGINILCGRFEGIDERIIEKHNIIEISIGDYVLSSGDLAAYVIIDTCLRNIKGILPSEEVLEEESFGKSEKYQYLLEYPHYTRPPIWEDIAVPDILLSGNHKKISEWRLAEAEKKTKRVRRDLWSKYQKNNK